MDKRKWLWKRKSSERSSGETESSGSMSSLSERYSDEQDTLKDSPSDNSQSPEVTSKDVVNDYEVKDSVKNLTEKLSAALVNVSAKEDLVKQHARVAEEAIAGWEKAENEVAALKQQLEAAVQLNLGLEVRVSHLDGALKECVRQLRQAKEENEQRIQDEVMAKTSEWESIKAELENKILNLQTHAKAAKSESPALVDSSNVNLKLEFIENENSLLKAEIVSLSEELEIRTIERDLSTEAAEISSKQQLESIKKVAKLEAECRRLQAIARKSSSVNNHTSVATSSSYVESLADSKSDSGEKVYAAVDSETRKLSKSEQYDIEPSCSDSWASALVAELDQFKNKKGTNKNLAPCFVDIDMMDDFLEMERLVSLPETKKVPSVNSCTAVENHSNLENQMKAELQMMTSRVAELEEKLMKSEAEKAEMESITSRVAELEETLLKIEAEKTKLEKALNESQDSLKASQVQLGEAETGLEELQKELALANESKESLELQLIGVEVEARTMAANIDSLKSEVEKEQTSSAEMATKYQEVENKLKNESQESELQQTPSSNNESKIKQEDFGLAADKLAECQKTIASLGRQLQSLATLEDFLIDTKNLPGFSGGKSLVPKAREESWKLHSNDTFTPRRDSDPSKIQDIASHSFNGNDGDSSASSSSSSSSSTNHTTFSKSRNGFGKLFSRSKTGIQLENHHGRLQELSET